MVTRANDVSVEEARRIAVRAQLLDGTATDPLTTVRRLGFLQLDPIATVMTPQELVLWSRLGSFDRTELDRLLWSERSLIEWNAFVYPVESLPALRGRMKRWRTSTRYSSERWVKGFLADNRHFARYVLRELERHGPRLSRDLEDRSVGEKREHRWYGSRMVGLMLTSLHLHGEIAVVGRRGGQRLWDLASRWYPETGALSPVEADRFFEAERFRALGVKLVKGRLVAHPHADPSPVPDRVTVLSPFDRLIHDRDRTERLWDFRYRLEMFVPRAQREYGYYVLPVLQGDRLVGRVEPVHDKKAGALRVLGAWGETARVREALQPLAAFLEARLEP